MGVGFEVDRGQLRSALLNASSANVFYLPEFTKVDLFGVGADAFDESEFSRRLRIEPRADLALWVKYLRVWAQRLNLSNLLENASITES